MKSKSTTFLYTHANNPVFASIISAENRARELYKVYRKSILWIYVLAWMNTISGLCVGVVGYDLLGFLLMVSGLVLCGVHCILCTKKYSQLLTLAYEEEQRSHT